MAVLDDCKSFFDKAYKGSDAAMKKDLKIMNSHGLNFLTLAAFLKHWKFITYFAYILKGDVNSEDPQGYTPLSRLCLAGELEGAEYLISNGCKVDFRNSKGQTALFFCI